MTMTTDMVLAARTAIALAALVREAVVRSGLMFEARTQAIAVLAALEEGSAPDAHRAWCFVQANKPVTCAQSDALVALGWLCAAVEEVNATDLVQAARTFSRVSAAVANVFLRTGTDTSSVFEFLQWAVPGVVRA